jgi:FkbM family methyltransferase
MAQIDMPTFAALLRPHVRDEEIYAIVDAGSHDGEDCAALVREFPWAHGLAIEGDPSQVARVDVAGLATRGVDFVHAVLAETPGTAMWHRQCYAPKISGIYDRQLRAPVHHVPVATRTLDDVCRAHDVPRVSILKVDCEGATLDVLIGLGDRIATVEAMHLETETAPYFHGMRYFDADVTAWCVAHGFREIARAGEEGQFDVVWVRNR